jgi:RNA polymerase sigma-70 factor (ECF subfamily)
MSAPDTARHAALLTWYSDHHGWLVGWLRRKLGSSCDAADFAQDTFVRLIGRDDLTAIRTPRAYLTTTATRLVIDDARRRKLEAVCLESWSILHGGETSPAPEQLLETVEILAELARMLDALPAKPRSAFLLHRLEGWNYGEIAAELGVSSSRVKQYVARALAHCYLVMEAA